MKNWVNIITFEKKKISAKVDGWPGYKFFAKLTNEFCSLLVKRESLDKTKAYFFWSQQTKHLLIPTKLRMPHIVQRRSPLLPLIIMQALYELNAPPHAIIMHTLPAFIAHKLLIYWRIPFSFVLIILELFCFSKFGLR